VHLDFLDLLARLDHRDLLEREESVVCQDLLGWLASLDQLASLDHLVYRAALERLDHRDNLEPRATAVSLAFRVFLDPLDLKDRRDLQAKMERTESQVQWAGAVLQGLMDPLVVWATLVPQDQEGHQARKAREVHLASSVLLGLLALQARAMEWTWLP
jgi:hypothetical protein